MNNFCHIEIPTKDPQRVKAFYETVFGWKVTQPEGFGEYQMFETDEGPGGGFNPELPIVKQAGVLPHILVDDIDGVLDTICNNGGSTVVPKTEIPGIGYYALFCDSEGNQMALYSGQ